MDRFDSADRTYYKKLLFKLAMIFLIIGGINWMLFGLFNINLVGGFGIFSTIIYILVGLSAIAIMFDRDTYLPFLGPTVVPCSVLKDRMPPGATREVRVTVTPGAKVLYWAAEPAAEKLKEINNWKKAYLEYDNAGVTTANDEGVAVFKVREPQGYKVPIMGALKPHIHYRVCGESGWMERIKTVFLDTGKVEGFECPCLKNNNTRFKPASLF